MSLPIRSLYAMDWGAQLDDVWGEAAPARGDSTAAPASAQPATFSLVRAPALPGSDAAPESTWIETSSAAHTAGLPNHRAVAPPAAPPSVPVTAAPPAGAGAGVPAGGATDGAAAVGRPEVEGGLAAFSEAGQEITKLLASLQLGRGLLPSSALQAKVPTAAGRSQPVPAPTSSAQPLRPSSSAFVVEMEPTFDLSFDVPASMTVQQPRVADGWSSTDANQPGAHADATKPAGAAPASPEPTAEAPKTLLLPTDVDWEDDEAFEASMAAMEAIANKAAADRAANAATKAAAASASAAAKAQSEIGTTRPAGDGASHEDGDIDHDGSSPLILVNLTKFAEDLGMGSASGPSLSMERVAAMIEDVIVDDVVSKTDELFEAGFAFHTDTLHVEEDEADIRGTLGEATQFHRIKYPPEVNGTLVLAVSQLSAYSVTNRVWCVCRCAHRGVLGGDHSANTVGEREHVEEPPAPLLSQPRVESGCSGGSGGTR